MNILNRNQIPVEGFGKKNLTLYEVTGTNQLLIATFKHKKKVYEGIVDVKGHILVPFDTVSIHEVFSTKDYTNYCFTRYNEENNQYHSYHLQLDNGIFRLIADIVGNDNTNCRLTGTEKDEFWLIEATTDGITEVSLYDVYHHKILTPGFTEISFEQEESRILAFVEKALYTKNQGKNIYLASLMAYIDYEGKLVTPLYNPEKEETYDSRIYNFDENFKSFYSAIQIITQNFEKEYFEKSERVDQELAFLFSNPYTEEEMKLAKRKTKIINFNNRRET